MYLYWNRISYYTQFGVDVVRMPLPVLWIQNGEGKMHSFEHLAYENDSPFSKGSFFT